MRTPAQIRRELVEADNVVARLTAELAGIPPTTLALNSPFNSTNHERTVVFHNDRHPRVVVRDERSPDQYLGCAIGKEDLPRLRAWLDHYYPQES